MPDKNEAQPSSAEMLVVGKISGVYGVKGWVKLFSYTDPREGIVDYDQCYLRQKGTWHAVTLTAGRKHGKGVIAKLDHCDDRDEAMKLIGTEIAIRREQLAELPPGEYYWNDLIGLKVINQDDTDLGQVIALMETGANDVLVVEGDRERLIPFTQGHAVTEVDLDQGVIRVDWDPEF